MQSSIVKLTEKNVFDKLNLPKILQPIIFQLWSSKFAGANSFSNIQCLKNTLEVNFSQWSAKCVAMREKQAGESLRRGKLVEELKVQVNSMLAARNGIEEAQEMEKILEKEQPDIVLVHGDTTTSMAAALAAFYQQIPVGHVEAGLRTHNIYSPWPEEMNRQITGRIAEYNFAPTPLSCQNLMEEN